ncbi:hypothetical protein PAPYR_9027 [Paratrimastix pyriformis]|uniref:Aminoglycoside phosphotransferase domain-containing protein n=1 Tax=Paratrimastix pyriformis TaxID=342808 RepID=A0ABQ8UDJ8_9EUKA|nr:hypothetical protein PAPYR_9027 [Paratrimastix pyriformis]
MESKQQEPPSPQVMLEFRARVQSLPPSPFGNSVLQMGESALRTLSQRASSSAGLATLFEDRYGCGVESNSLAALIHEYFPPRGLWCLPASGSSRSCDPTSVCSVLLERRLFTLTCHYTVALPLRHLYISAGLAAVLQTASEEIGSASDFARHPVVFIPRLGCEFTVTRFGRVSVAPQLAHRAFMEFTGEFEGPADPDFSLCPILGELAHCLAEAARGNFPEQAMVNVAKDLVAQLLGIPEASLASRSVPNHDGSQCDLAYTVGQAQYPVLIAEVKKQLNGEALFEVGAYFAQLWADRPIACCPSFLLQWCGSYFAAAAAMATPDGIFIEELTPFIGVMFYQNPASRRPALKFFTALRRALKTLADTVVVAVSETPQRLDDRFPFFFAQPLKMHIDEQIAESLCFRAQQQLVDQEPPKPVVVKVVFGHYGLEAHQILSDAGLAPALLACYELPSLRSLYRRAATGPRPEEASEGTFSGPFAVGVSATATPTPTPTPTPAAWPALPDIVAATAATAKAPAVLVVMEALPDFRPWKACSCAERASLVPALRRAASLLHDRVSPLVHGDLRGRNVGAIGDPTGGGVGLCLQVLDFDWADRVPDARYPLGLNPDVMWPGGVADGGPILPDHDNVWVDRLEEGVVVVCFDSLSGVCFYSPGQHVYHQCGSFLANLWEIFLGNCGVKIQKWIPRFSCIKGAPTLVFQTIFAVMEDSNPPPPRAVKIVSTTPQDALAMAESRIRDLEEAIPNGQ